MPRDEGIYSRVAWPARQAEVDAARALFLAGRHEEAAPAYDRLAAAAAEIPDPADAALVCEQSACCHAPAGRLARAAEWLAAADGYARRSGDARAQASLLRRRVILAGHRRDAAAAAEAAQEAVARFARSPDPAARADAHAAHGTLLQFRLEHRSAAREHRRAFLASRGLPARARLGYLMPFTTALSAADDPRRAIRLAWLCRKAATALDPPMPDMAANLGLFLAPLLLRRNDEPRAAAVTAECYATFRGLRMNFGAVQALEFTVHLCLEAGWASHALRAAERIRAEMGGLADDPVHGRRWVAYEFDACLHLGLRARLKSLAPRLAEWAAAAPDSPWRSLAGLHLRRYAEERRDWDEARRLAEAGTRMVKSVRLDPDAAGWFLGAMIEHQVALARIELEVGDAKKARARLAQARAAGPERTTPTLRAIVDTVESRLCLAERDAAGAVRAARRAWARMHGWGWPDGLAMAGGSLLRALHADGRTDEARRIARDTAWVLGWIAARLDPEHRAPFYRPPATRELLRLLHALGQPDDPVCAYRAAPACPFRWPRLPRLEEALATLERSGLLAAPEPDLSPEAREERARLRETLDAHAWNVSAAARAMAIDRTTLLSRLKRFSLKRPSADV